MRPPSQGDSELGSTRSGALLLPETVLRSVSRVLGRIAGYPGSMAKSQDKKRNAKTNKPKLTAKEKKLKKAAKKAK